MLPRTAEAKREKALRLQLRQERAPRPLDQGGGMFFYERAFFAVRRALERARQALKPKAQITS